MRIAVKLAILTPVQMVAGGQDRNVVIIIPAMVHPVVSARIIASAVVERIISHHRHVVKVHGLDRPRVQRQVEVVRHVAEASVVSHVRLAIK